jgi:hypothetical protein
VDLNPPYAMVIASLYAIAAWMAITEVALP